MHCPYCRTAVHESTPECPTCKMTISRISALFGPVPRFHPGLENTARLLFRREMAQLQFRLDELKHKYPQVVLHLIVHEFPVNYPFDLYLFWIFNVAGLSEESHRGGDNHDVMLAIDPVQKRVGFVFGYGLEPFVRQDAVEQLLALTEPVLKEKRWMDAIMSLIDGLDLILETAAITISDAFGVTTEMTPELRDGEY